MFYPSLTLLEVSSDYIGALVRSFDWEIHVYIFALLPCKSDTKQKKLPKHVSV